MQAPSPASVGWAGGEGWGTSRVCPQTLLEAGGFHETPRHPPWVLAAPSSDFLGDFPLSLTFLARAGDSSSLTQALSSPEARHVSPVVPQHSAPSSNPPQVPCNHTPDTFRAPGSRLGISCTSYHVLVPVL